MHIEFVNREPELRELDAAAKRGGLTVVFGRRRVGKTRLLTHWLHERDGLYSQAIEAQRDLQIQQTFEDLRARLDLKQANEDGWRRVGGAISQRRRRRPGRRAAVAIAEMCGVVLALLLVRCRGGPRHPYRGVGCTRQQRSARNASMPRKRTGIQELYAITRSTILRPVRMT
jgi:hypothetical protein